MITTFIWHFRAIKQAQYTCNASILQNAKKSTSAGKRYNYFPVSAEVLYSVGHDFAILELYEAPHGVLPQLLSLLSAF